jgi:haloalkane dehalogenase
MTADAPARPAWLAPGLYPFASRFLASRPFLAEVEQGLGALRGRPALIVWPTRDPAFGARERQRWEALFSDHETMILEGAGHYMQEDATGEIVAAIRAWADRRGGVESPQPRSSDG